MLDEIQPNKSDDKTPRNNATNQAQKATNSAKIDVLMTIEEDKNEGDNDIV